MEIRVVAEEQHATKPPSQPSLSWYFAALGVVGGGMVGGMLHDQTGALIGCTALSSFLLGRVLDRLLARSAQVPWLSWRSLLQLVLFVMAVVCAGIVNAAMLVALTGAPNLSNFNLWLLVVSFGSGFALVFVPPLLVIWMTARRVYRCRPGSIAWRRGKLAVAQATAMVCAASWLFGAWHAPFALTQLAPQVLGPLVFAAGIGLLGWDLLSYLKLRQAVAAWHRGQPWLTDALDRAAVTDFGIGDGYRCVTEAGAHPYRDQPRILAIYQGDGEQVVRAERRRLVVGVAGLFAMSLFALATAKPHIEVALHRSLASAAAKADRLLPRCGRPTLRAAADGQRYQLCLAR